MRRSKMITEIYKVLKTWEGCQIEQKMAKEVLDRIEELGIEPPAFNMIRLSTGEWVKNNGLGSSEFKYWENENEEK